MVINAAAQTGAAPRTQRAAGLIPAAGRLSGARALKGLKGRYPAAPSIDRLMKAPDWPRIVCTGGISERLRRWRYRTFPVGLCAAVRSDEV